MFYAVTMRMSRVTDTDAGTLRGDLAKLAGQLLDLSRRTTRRDGRATCPCMMV